MAEASFTRPTRSNGTAIAVVLLMHGTALTALALSKMEVIKERFRPTIVIDVKDPPPPPPKSDPLPEPKAPTEPEHVSVVTIPKPVIVPPPIFDNWKADPSPPIQPPPLGDVAQKTVEPSPPPPPPPARTIEPARARANLASYVSDTDYPAAAIRGEEQGTARFRLTVGADGRVTGCAITGSSGSSSLDAATCRIMKSRARFTPARDSSGAATADTVSNAIRWVLPE